VLGEEAFLFRDHQCGSIHQRDVAKDCLLHFRTRGLRDMDAEGKLILQRAEKRHGAGCGLEKATAGEGASGF
jgi:hypothetical protein